MNIVFDMDNTLADEFGKEVRPGILDLLQGLRDQGHVLVLWTSSTRQRARIILREHDLDRFFARFVYREDYDPQNEGLVKDIRQVDGDVLVDDDPKQVNFANSIGKRGVLITAYRGGEEPDPDGLKNVRKKILGWRNLFRFRPRRRGGGSG